MSIKEWFRLLPPIEYAPLNVPFERRRQTLVTFVVHSVLLTAFALTLILIFFPKSWPLLIPYFIWIYYDPAPYQGARPIEFVRRSSFFKHYADYFKTTLHKEVDLDPTKNYIFGYHPHGIISIGAQIAIGSEATGWSDLFPNIKNHLLTLGINFKVPFYREILLGMGIADVSKKSILNILNSGPGKSCTIVVGGAAESLLAYPNRLDLVLVRRYGFIKIALQTGAQLVPIFAFGENDIFDQYKVREGTIVARIQAHIKSFSRFTVPLFYGRGIFSYNYGPLPKRVPLDIVVGRPIPVNKISNPTQEDIETLHSQYVEGLKSLYHKHKDRYYSGKNCPELTLVG